MDLKDILAISGQSGLFKFISQGRQGIIVESFADKKRTCVYATQKVNALADIAIYTDNEEIPLSDIFKNIYKKENGGESIDYKSSPEELKKYMAEICPEYDRERVYVSDIKKVINWYNTLIKLKLLKFDEEKEEKKEEKEEESKEEKVEVKQPKETIKKPKEALKRVKMKAKAESKNIAKDVKRIIPPKTGNR
jgi:hypothetical protein